MDISESLEKVFLSTHMMGARFYKQFFADCPEAESYFQGVDMHHQAVVVTMSLTLVEQYYRSPYKPTEAYFHYLGKQHQEKNIPKTMYPIWVNSMLKALADFHGHDWDDTLARQWREGFEASIHQMFTGYEIATSTG